MNHIVLLKCGVLLLQQAAELRITSNVLGYEPVVRGRLGVRDTSPLNLRYYIRTISYRRKIRSPEYSY